MFDEAKELMQNEGGGLKEEVLPPDKVIEHILAVVVAGEND